MIAPATAAAADRTPPSTPTLRLAAIGKTSVALAWTRATDNSGRLTYNVRLWQNPTTVTLPQSQTSYSWSGPWPDVRYYFWVEAVDPSANRSTSNLLTVTTLRDSSPPAAPANLRVTNVGASQASLSWDAPADTGMFINGALDTLGATTGRGRTITYGVDGENTFVVRAVDSAGNVSAPSNEFRIALDVC